MSVLLDTNALIWLLLDIHRLGPETRQLADSALIDSELLVSAFSFWEVSMLMQKNRMDIEQDMSEWRDAVLDMGVREIALSGDIGILSTELDGLPADPADRIIVATALAREATLVTADARILDWRGTLDRHDART
jgi:PIN domain nuclease of toxin-antitoxin system